MAELNREFGNLLTQGLKSLAAHEDKPILTLEDEVGNLLETTRWSVEKWRQGSVPPDSKKIVALARICVTRGGMSRPWLLRFLTQAQFLEKEVLVRELFPDEKHAVTPIRRNIPGRPYLHFVGRDKEKAEMRRYLSPKHRVGVVCLSGPAGVGKTALAIEVAHSYLQDHLSLLPDERFEAIVWVTAKQTELLATGIAHRHPTLTDLDSMHRAIAEVLDMPAITRVIASEDRDILVAQTLAERRILIVLDNLEDIDDSSLMIFLRELPAPSKAIVTTRHRVDVAVSLHLTAFIREEAHQLIRVTCQAHDLTLSDEQVEKLLQRTGCLPLAIVRTLGRVAWRGSTVEAELRQLGEPSNILYEFCFEKSIALIRGKDAHKLFMALSLFFSDATREALGYVAGFERNILDRDEGLSDLEVLSLVIKKDDRFSLEPLTKVQAQIELATQQNFKQEAQERLIEWYKLFAKQIELEISYAQCLVEIENLAYVIDWLMDRGRMADVGWLFQRIRKFLFAEGRWEFLVPLAEKVARWAESMNDAELLSGTLESLTWVFREQGDFTRTKMYLENAQTLATRMKSNLLQAEVWVNLAGARYRQAIQPEEELSMVPNLSWAIEVFGHLNKTDRMVDALNTLGNLYLKQKCLAEAQASFLEGLKVIERDGQSLPNVRQWRAALRGNLCQIAVRQGCYKQAREELYEFIDDFTDKTDRAETYTRLALCEYHLGNTEQALHYQRLAEQIMEQLNLKRPLCVEDEEWMSLRIT